MLNAQALRPRLSLALAAAGMTLGAAKANAEHDFVRCGSRQAYTGYVPYYAPATVAYSEPIRYYPPSRYVHRHRTHRLRPYRTHYGVARHHGGQRLRHALGHLRRGLSHGGRAFALRLGRGLRHGHRLGHFRGRRRGFSLRGR